jgi:molybdopterin/thiamine biosynthesis adenylyltransferase
MSHRLIDHSPDLLALRAEKYNISVRNGYLLIRDVPYVTSNREVREDGVLVSTLDTQVVEGQQRTAKPTTHVTYWVGEHPCHINGEKIRNFENPSDAQDFGNGLRVNFTFSAKADYRDYVHKMQAYLGWIVGEAQKIKPEATAQTNPVYATDAVDDDVFNYIDTASSRVHIGADNEKLENHRLAIIGLGGTGSYVFDLVAKTRVAEIRLFDDDEFDPHNAFRAPGAWSLAELEQKKKKVTNLTEIYSKLRRKGVVPHPVKLNANNLHLLDGIHFAFLCMDGGKDKQAIVEWLVAHKIPFIDVGIGIIRAPEGLQGIVQIVTATPGKYDHVLQRISFGADEEAENEYATNIQVAELNSLNAALAVIRWKRLLGFYRDAGKEHFSSYQIATGELCNEDQS